MANLLSEIINAVIDKYGRYKRTEYFYEENRVLYDREVDQHCIKYGVVTEYLTKEELERAKKEGKYAKM